MMCQSTSSTCILFLICYLCSSSNGLYPLICFARNGGTKTEDCPLNDWKFNNEGDLCRTPNGADGICISLRECPSLFQLLQQRPIAQSTVEYLRRSQCGFVGNFPKVCCPDTRPVGPQPPTPRPQPPTPRPQTPTPRPQTPTPRPQPTPQVERPADVSRHRNLGLLRADLCGPINKDRITGGNKTSVFEYPWMALIAYRTRNGLRYRCGGSVINDRYVLTAAHCVTSLPSSFTLVGVRLGDHDTSTDIDCEFYDQTRVCAQPPQDFGIDQAIPHPGFSKSTLKDDIALIRLDRMADFNPDTVRPICLPVGSQQWRYLDNETLTVAGWGATENGTGSNDLLQADIPVVTNDECARIYERSAKIGPKQLCAGGLEGIDSCAGDSGGPLKFADILQNEQRYHQFGIVSFGPRNCGTRGRPGVYTRVGHYMKWILDNMRP